MCTVPDELPRKRRIACGWRLVPNGCCLALEKFLCPVSRSHFNFPECRLTHSLEMSLDNLFEEILVTEQKALEKRQFLKGVKSEIIRCNEKLRDITENLHRNKSTLESKVNDLSEELFHLELLKKQEESLKKQREEIIKENNNYHEALEKKKKKIAEEREKFVQEISEFNAKYDLISNRIITIEIKAKSKIFDLETEAKHLKNDMKCFEQKNVHLNALQNQKNELKEEILQLQDKYQGLENEVTKVVFDTKALEEEKVNVCQKPQTDHEFLRNYHRTTVHKMTSHKFHNGVHLTCQVSKNMLEKDNSHNLKKKKDGTWNPTMDCSCTVNLEEMFKICAVAFLHYNFYTILIQSKKMLTFDILKRLSYLWL
ncbi:coiled-coil domain-containing protein 172 [Heterodontus francisci]|uniref:coiled-coil domain-containing protein 172 n=1 Tax=Heterodontus francisci TaxID=7792 RepID=UPI00355C91CD